MKESLWERIYGAISTACLIEKETVEKDEMKRKETVIFLIQQGNQKKRMKIVRRVGPKVRVVQRHTGRSYRSNYTETEIVPGQTTETIELYQLNPRTLSWERIKWKEIEKTL